MHRMLRILLLFITTFCLASQPDIPGIKANNSANRPALNSYLPQNSLTEKIHKTLQKAPEINPEAIDFRVKEGVVVLFGSVDNLLMKERTAHLLQHLNGVRAVVNNLTVPTTRGDEQIKKDLITVLEENPVTLDWKIWGSVENNVITLEGLVDTWRARQYAGQLVKGIKGVRAVQNRIQIDQQKTITDAELENSIEQFLKWDARIADGEVDVIVNQRKAVVIGTVPNAYQKALAIQQAHIPGIKEVEANNLTIEVAAKSQIDNSVIAENPSSTDIKKAINQAISYNPRIQNTENITINVRGTTVTLTGQVDHLVAKLAAGQIATNTVGVNEVNNELSIDKKAIERSNIPVTDAAIQKRLQEAIARDVYINLKNIEITVESGVIQLDGHIDSYYKKVHAGNLASQVIGTVAINNNLDIRKGT